MARSRGPGASAISLSACCGWRGRWSQADENSYRVGYVAGQPQQWPPEEFHVTVFVPRSPCCTFLPQKPAAGQACPFTEPPAHHSYCFKKNFLALSLKLNCPLRVSYFVCSRLSCGGPTLSSLLPERLRRAKSKRRSISVCLLPSASQGRRTHVPLEAGLPQCPEGQSPSAQNIPLASCQKNFSMTPWTVSERRHWLVWCLLRVRKPRSD